MRLSYHSTVIFVKNIEKSKQFYLKLPGFNVAYDFGKSIGFSNKISLWEINPDHPIAKESDLLKSSGFELCFETDDIINIFAQIKKLGVKFLHEIREETWSQQTIRFYDPDGHLIEIGEDLPTFINRCYHQGMSVEKIHKKTSVAPKIIMQIIN